MHKKCEECVEAAGDAGVLRVKVLGHTRVLLVNPATLATVLRPGVFLPKPTTYYNVLSILVRLAITHHLDGLQL